MENKLFDFTRRRFTIVFLLLLLWVIIGPIVLTQFSIIDFTNTGQIGDTISGISAPIIGLFTTLLLFWTLMSQVDFNKSQRLESNFQIIYEEIKNLRNQIDLFNYNGKSSKDAIIEFATDGSVSLIYPEIKQNFTISVVEKFSLFYFSFNRINFLLTKLKTSPEYNDFIKAEIKHIFIYNFNDAVNEMHDRWGVSKDDNSNYNKYKMFLIKEEFKIIQDRIFNKKK